MFHIDAQNVSKLEAKNSKPIWTVIKLESIFFLTFHDIYTGGVYLLSQKEKKNRERQNDTT